MLPLIIALFIALITSLWIFVLTRDKKIVLYNLIFTLISPWFLILASGQFPFGIESSKILKCNQNSAAQACFASLETLYFIGDSRIKLHIEDQGFLLLSTLPLMVVGIYSSLRQNKILYQVTFLALIFSAIISFSLEKNPNLGSALFYLPLLAVFTSFGAYQYSKHLYVKGPAIVKFLIITNLLWIFYESLRLYQIIFWHRPFQI